MGILLSNNAKTTITLGLTSDTLTLVVQDASRFPTIIGGDYFFATLASGTPESKWEIVKVTATNGTSFTVERGQEGSVAQAWSPGTTLEMRITKGVFDLVFQQINAAQYVAPLAGSEITITGAATATIGRYHRCSGTTSDYVVTLPPLVGNAGKQIAFIMDGALTKLVTLKGNGPELIDGQNTRVMWAKESCILRANDAETQWEKIAGRTLPMSCRIYPSTNQLVITSNDIKIQCNTAAANIGNMTDLPNNRILIRRTGSYSVDYKIRWEAVTDTDVCAWLYIGGSGVSFSQSRGAYNTVGDSLAPVTINANTAVELYGTQYSGSSRNISPGQAFTGIGVVEIPSW